MVQRHVAPSELEVRIGRLERQHDLKRDHLAALERGLANKQNVVPTIHNKDLYSKEVFQLEQEVAAARSDFERVRGELESAWAERNRKEQR